MNAERRINISTCWASTRICFLDGLEDYEDSYAITQEFREWITSIGEYPEQITNNLLWVPNFVNKENLEETNDTDEVVEI